MAFPTADTLTALVEPAAAAQGMDIEALKINRAGKKTVVAIAVDADGRPDLDALEELSKEISEIFDEAEKAGTVAFGGEGYTLEVSTPGVDHPLEKPRHWRRNRGRLCTWKTEDDAGKGRIGALNEDETAVALISREGKNLVVKPVELAQIAQAMVEIEFAAVPAEEQAVAEEDFNTAVHRREEHK